jgi:hypothetical protein
MGLISKIGEMRMKDPVEGSLNVVGISMPDPTATSANYRLDGVVSGPDVPPTPVVHHGMASVRKWPSPGQVLPVTVDRAKPERLVINWDKVTTGQAAAQSAAAQLAEQMRGGSTSPGTMTFTTTQTGGAIDTQALIAQALGMSDAQVQSMPTPQGPPPIVSAADILARGTAGLASVEAVFPSAETTQKPNHTVVGLALTVMVAGQPTNMIKNLYAVPNEKLGAVVVGTTVPVKVDLSNPGLVAVDWAAVAG